ncbi:type II toxin-antitoxin system VapB family antitoxin [Ornithinimicrobium sp. F0845]|uniref:type II toxin-antitoxin system VapB family antitoxin n=1 Tax=Ornithinimicrobium sp. F0845 TaxID=2926412 RepID=UPI001FF165AA|nr:type II toxin-antitoxin system VapB family antitoxin [Ornithinimicrobium sp. F0845]
MSRTLIDTDDDLLERARFVLGTSTKRATVNAALGEVVALHARREFLADARRGELADAVDPAVMDAAWRR